MEPVTLNQIIYLFITVLAVPLVKLACDAIRAKIAGTQYSEAMDAVLASVEYLNQTMVDSLKQSGCFDKESQATALSIGVQTATELLTKGAINYIHSTGMEIEDWLTVQIEATIKQTKKGDAA